MSLFHRPLALAAMACSLVSLTGLSTGAAAQARIGQHEVGWQTCAQQQKSRRRRSRRSADRCARWCPKCTSVLTPGVLREIANQPRGVGGEIQLTDGIADGLPRQGRAHKGVAGEQGAAAALPAACVAHPARELRQVDLVALVLQPGLCHGLLAGLGMAHIPAAV